MKRNLAILFVLAGLVMPSLTFAQDVNTSAGNISLLAHIDFVARLSPEDDPNTANGYYGYETYNIEAVVIGLAGQLDDNVNWLVTYSYGFYGPNAAAASYAGGPVENSAGTLLDARVNWMLFQTEGFMNSLTLSFGRFIPPTSMTFQPHMLSNLKVLNYPLINGSGFQGLSPYQVTNGSTGNYWIPLPMYQTGVQMTGKFFDDAVSIMVGHFNGTDPVASYNTGVAAFPGINNTMDIDKTKGTNVKVQLDMSGFHLGGFYYFEEASITYASGAMEDARIDQYGVEAAYESDSLFAQAQYMTTNLDWQDIGSQDLVQWGAYGLIGINIENVQIVGRYDYMDYDADDTILDVNPVTLVFYDANTETMISGAVNWLITEQTTLGFNYNYRDVEGWEVDINEFALIVEMDLF